MYVLIEGFTVVAETAKVKPRDLCRACSKLSGWLAVRTPECKAPGEEVIGRKWHGSSGGGVVLNISAQDEHSRCAMMALYQLTH